MKINDLKTPPIRKYIPLILYFLYIGLILSAFTPVKRCLESPILSYDHPFHLTNAEQSANFFLKNKNNCGYTTLTASGATICQSVSNRFITPIFLLFPFVQKDLLYTLVVFIALLTTPLIIGYASTLFFGRCFLLKTVGLCSLLFISSPIIHQFIFVGHWGFLLSLAISLLASGILYKYKLTGKRSLLILQAFLYALSLWTHLLSCFLSIPFILSTISLCYKEKETNKALKIFFITAITVVSINFFWLSVLIKYIFLWHEHGSMAHYLQSNQLWNGRLFNEIFIASSVVFAIYQYFKNKKNRSIVLPLVASMILLAVVSSCGSYIGLQDTQPVRNVIAIAIIATIIMVQHRHSIVISLVASGIFFSNYYNREGLSRWVHNSHCGLPQEGGEQLVEFLKHHVDRSSRTLIQMSHSTQYYGTRIASILAYRLGIPIVNKELPYPKTFTSFINDTLMNTYIENIKNEDLEKYMELYNIGHVLVFSDTAGSKLKKTKMFKEVYHHDSIKVFDYINHNDSYCYKCKAKVSVSNSTILVNNINDENELILKLHKFVPQHIEPSNIQISSIHLHKDPAPFIKLKGAKGTKSIKISF